MLRACDNLLPSGWEALYCQAGKHSFDAALNGAEALKKVAANVFERQNSSMSFAVHDAAEAFVFDSKIRASCLYAGWVICGGVTPSFKAKH